MRRLILAASVAAILSTSAAAQPVTYAWRIECAEGKTFGPFGTPDACREERRTIALTCEQPTIHHVEKLTDPEHIRRYGELQVWDTPNPAFVRIADVCQESLNGRGCTCVYVAYEAVPSGGTKRKRTVLDVLKEADAARGCIRFADGLCRP